MQTGFLVDGESSVCYALSAYCFYLQNKPAMGEYLDGTL
jgi:hypothetical protein